MEMTDYVELLRQEFNDRVHLAPKRDGELFTLTSSGALYEIIMRFSRAITAISSMSLYRRDVVRSLFYEMLGDFETTDLSEFAPEASHHPIPERDDLEVDYRMAAGRPLFLFGVKDGSKRAACDHILSRVPAEQGSVSDCSYPQKL